MNTQLLSETVKQLFADNKGLLAMDESTGTCDKRFEKVGIPQTVEAPKSLSRIDCDRSGAGREHRRRNSL